MEVKQIREMWGQFDALIASDISPDAKAIITAIRMQTELMNSRLAMIEHGVAAQARGLPPGFANRG